MTGSAHRSDAPPQGVACVAVRITGIARQKQAPPGDMFAALPLDKQSGLRSVPPDFTEKEEAAKAGKS